MLRVKQYFQIINLNFPKNKILLSFLILTITAYISFINYFVLEINKSYDNVVIDVILLLLGVLSFKVVKAKIITRFFVVFFIFIIYVYKNNRDKANLLLTVNGIREFDSERFITI